MSKIIYKQFFSRDFTLAIIESWWKGEVLEAKGWIAKKQPYYPYIIFQRENNAVKVFYDERGIIWCKEALNKKLQSDPNFLLWLETNFRKKFKTVESIYKRRKELSLPGLKNFFKDLLASWPLFEANWWLWDDSTKGLKNWSLPDSLIKLRLQTHDFIPDSEIVIRKTIKKIYPAAADYSDVLLIKEILNGRIPSIEELRQRKKSYFYTGNKLFTGISGSAIESKYKIKLAQSQLAEKISQVKGQKAYGGKARGRVKLIFAISELAKVKKGDVIISPMTMPDFMTAIKKASSIVTDEGGLLCHAAIIARELKKPCIIGTQTATRVFKDGDLVEVDANKGIVKKIK